MLVLGRKVGEEIIIGDDIVITVLQVQGNRIKIGIQAPNSVPIQRPDGKPQCPKPSRDLSRSDFWALDAV